MPAKIRSPLSEPWDTQRKRCDRMCLLQSRIRRTLGFLYEHDTRSRSPVDAGIPGRLLVCDLVACVPTAPPPLPGRARAAVVAKVRCAVCDCRVCMRDSTVTLCSLCVQVHLRPHVRCGSGSSGKQVCKVYGRSTQVGTRAYAYVKRGTCARASLQFDTKLNEAAGFRAFYVANRIAYAVPTGLPYAFGGYTYP